MNPNNYIINNCNAVIDSIQHVFFDTTHIYMDSAVSFDALIKTQNLYESTIANINTSVNNATTWVGVLITIIALLTGIKFFWDYKLSIAIFHNYTKKINKYYKNEWEKNQQIILSTYLNIAEQLLTFSKNSTKDSFLHFFSALNYVLSIDYNKEVLNYIERIFAGLKITWSEGGFGQNNVAYYPLKQLSNKLKKKENEKNCILLATSIVSFLNETEQDIDDNQTQTNLEENGPDIDDNPQT